jgi:hypothetical protein
MQTAESSAANVTPTVAQRSTLGTQGRLEATGGSTSRAAEILRMSVRKVQYELHEHEGAPKSALPSVASGAQEEDQ